MWIAVFASGLGTFVMLALYVQFFKRKEQKNEDRINMNYVIGAITAIIAVITAFNIFKDVL